LDWRKLTPPEFEVVDDAAIRELLTKGTATPYEKQYIRKDGSRVAVLVGGAQYEDNKYIAFVVDLTELKGAQHEATRLAQIVESTDEAIIAVSRDGEILSWNKGAETLYGYSKNEVVGRPEEIIFPNGRDKEYEAVKNALSAGLGGGRFETIRITKSNEPKPVSITISPMRDAAGTITGWSKIARDLTEARRAQQLEEQFRQAQILESIGRLAGGVAHDFNNLLMVISSYTEMMQDRLEPNHKLRNNTREVLKATEKAAALTQQLLAFSRKQVLMQQIVDLNAIVDDTAKMAKRLIGEDVEMQWHPGKDLWAIRADPGQITQILLNLYINARDAMPKGGILTIETSNLVVDPASASHQHRSFPPGPYAVLVVSDNGTGMTEKVKERIFEPFFTTKDSKGTGLGLSTVYGIVKQSGGYIWVQSTLGHGSRFELYFPQVNQPLTKATPATEPSGEGNGETILVVEDEDSLRASVCEYLAEQGYEVLQAQNGDQALDISDGHSGPIHVLLTDVVMPKMSGVEVARRLSGRHEMLTIFMSGYTDDAIVNHGVLQPGVSLINKPFSLGTLARKIREELGRRAGGQRPSQDQFLFKKADS
jgi:two-component system, cell cycle sensor histidine kinase and response regulator CckA